MAPGPIDSRWLSALDPRSLRILALLERPG
jgi:hypothetical protein